MATTVTALKKLLYRMHKVEVLKERYEEEMDQMLFDLGIGSDGDWDDVWDHFYEERDKLRADLEARTDKRSKKQLKELIKWLTSKKELEPYTG